MGGSVRFPDRGFVCAKVAGAPAFGAMVLWSGTLMNARAASSFGGGVVRTVARCI
jgi:hypothetical protein